MEKMPSIEAKQDAGAQEETEAKTDKASTYSDDTKD
jgi:hypothetical protein